MTIWFMPVACPQGVISLQQQPSSVELCLSPPGEGSVRAQQTAAYTPRLAPGSVTWQLKKSVQLPPVFVDGVVQMIQGDTVVSTGGLCRMHSVAAPPELSLVQCLSLTLRWARIRQYNSPSAVLYRPKLLFALKELLALRDWSCIMHLGSHCRCLLRSNIAYTLAYCRIHPGKLHVPLHVLQEAAWTLSATKSGDEATYQGVVSGRISITNSRPVPVTVYGVLTAVKEGPSAVISCGPAMPFQVRILQPL